MAPMATQEKNARPPQQDRRAAEVWAGTSGWKRFVAVSGRALERLYRRRMGWLFGHRLAVITHTGRRSGRVYRTVVYVQDYDPATRAVTVVSVWGDSDWYRNIRRRPALALEVGRERLERPEQRYLTPKEIAELEIRFRQVHPVLARGQAKLMHWPWPATTQQLRQLAEPMRGVVFRPAASSRISSSRPLHERPST